MFGLHMPELIIVLVIALLVFGPKKLPEMGSAIGKSIKEFRKGVNDISKDADLNASKQAPPISDADFNRLLSGNIKAKNESVNVEAPQAELPQTDLHTNE